MSEKSIPELTLQDLNTLYSDSETCDKAIFAEMRTNLQIVAGQHYNREGSRYWGRIQSNRALSQEQKLRLTRNHTQVVTKTYRNAIESAAPDVQIVAANEKELQDQKSAEMFSSYWDYIKECNNFADMKSTLVKNFVEIGEVCAKVFWDMDGGQVVGYEAEGEVDESTGEFVPAMDEMGQVKKSDRPVYGGKLKIEPIEAYNLRRDPSSRSISESPYLTISKLISVKKLRTFVSEEMAKKLEANAPTTEYSVYDENLGKYVTKTGQILIKETYYRPGPKIPNGYFFIFSDSFEIDRGELPYGVFPIVHEGFDEQTGSARSHSVIRHIRPAQIDINRTISKIAEHQITLGDDKAWVSSNTKVTQGSYLPGVRVNSYSGLPPTIVPGRSGDQYFAYLEGEIKDLYRLANVEEIIQDKPESPDLYANLMRSFRFRKKFIIYGEKIERFLKRIVTTALDLAQHCANEQELVPILGKSEYLNIEQFKQAENIHYRVKLKPRTDDFETQFGKQIMVERTLQYVGGQLDKEDIGKLLRLAPFLNQEQSFEDLTIKYDNMVNDILAMDRGQFRPPRKYQDHDYIIKNLTLRMSKSDYEFLPPQIQKLYEMKLQMHEQLKAKEIQEIQRAKDGFIPSGGYMVRCDFYSPDPKDPTKTKRLALPSEAIGWLVKQLEVQGSSLAQLEQQSTGALSDMSEMLLNNQNGGMNGNQGSNYAA